MSQLRVVWLHHVFFDFSCIIVVFGPSDVSMVGNFLTFCAIEILGKAEVYSQHKSGLWVQDVAVSCRPSHR